MQNSWTTWYCVHAMGVSVLRRVQKDLNIQWGYNLNLAVPFIMLFFVEKLTPYAIANRVSAV